MPDEKLITLNVNKAGGRNSIKLHSNDDHSMISAECVRADVPLFLMNADHAKLAEKGQVCVSIRHKNGDQKWPGVVCMQRQSLGEKPQFESASRWENIEVFR